MKAESNALNGITFGAMAPPICKQVGVQNSDIQLCQRLADAITLLRIQELLTDRQAHAARKKLTARIGRVVSAALAEDEKRKQAALIKQGKDGA